jgi:hypothetical protein
MRLLFLLVMLGGALAHESDAYRQFKLPAGALHNMVANIPPPPERECDATKHLTVGEYDALLARLAGLDAAVKSLEAHGPMLARLAKREEDEPGTYWGVRYWSRLEAVETLVQDMKKKLDATQPGPPPDGDAADAQILRARVRGLEHQYMAVETLVKQQGVLVQKLQHETVQSIGNVAAKLNEIYAALHHLGKQAAGEL